VCSRSSREFLSEVKLEQLKFKRSGVLSLFSRILSEVKWEIFIYFFVKFRDGFAHQLGWPSCINWEEIFCLDDEFLL